MEIVCTQTHKVAHVDRFAENFFVFFGYFLVTTVVELIKTIYRSTAWNAECCVPDIIFYLRGESGLFLGIRTLWARW